MSRLLGIDSPIASFILVRNGVLRNYRPHGKLLVTSGERPVPRSAFVVKKVAYSNVLCS